MIDKIESNVVNIIGEVCSEAEYSHELFGEVFYKVMLKVPRLSASEDLLPMTVSERLMNEKNICLGDKLVVDGQLRSYNKVNGDGNKLILTVFARNIEMAEADAPNLNQIFIDGFICKKPMYRTTPFGREITDMLIAINRAYNKSDYIPCIAWGRNAKFSEKMKIGDKIKIWGRVQSREYQKKISEDETITKVAYEVSISKMEVESKDRLGIINTNLY